ncbi:YD repeat, partial [Trinorchestia longiramus]
IKSLLPEPNSKDEYEIFSPDTHEVYVFNRFGQHVSTRNVVTDQVIYNFTYTVKSPSGKLSTVIDAAGNRIQLMRDGNGEVTSIENPLKQRIQVKLNMRNQLEELVGPDGYNITFRYHVISWLLLSKVERGGSTYSYDYDNEGRLSRTVLPTGQVISLNYALSVRGAQVTVARDENELETTTVRGSSITHTAGFVRTVSQGKGGIVRKSAWHHEVSLHERPFKVLETMSPTAAQMFPVLALQQTKIDSNTIN